MKIEKVLLVCLLAIVSLGCSSTSCRNIKVGSSDKFPTGSIVIVNNYDTAIRLDGLDKKEFILIPEKSVRVFKSLGTKHEARIRIDKMHFCLKKDLEDDLQVGPFKPKDLSLSYNPDGQAVVITVGP